MKMNLIRLEKEKQQYKGEADDIRASVDHLSRDKVMVIPEFIKKL